MEFFFIMFFFFILYIVFGFKNTGSDYSDNKKRSKYFTLFLKEFDIPFNAKFAKHLNIQFQRSSLNFSIRLAAKNQILIFAERSEPLQGLIKIYNIMGNWNSIGEGVKTYDLEFDGELQAYSSNKEYIVAYLRKDIRDLLLDIKKLTNDLEVSSSWIKASLSYGYHEEPQELIQVVKKIIEVQNHFNKIYDFKKALLYNVRKEKKPLIRLNNLKTFILKYGSDKDSKNEIKTFLNDKETSIRFHAARYLGEEGLPDLLDIIKNTKLEDHDLTEAINSFGNYSYLESIDLLKNIYEQSYSLDVQSSIIKALGEMGDGLCEIFLLDTYKSVEDTSLKLVFFKSLGLCGTVKSVEPLRGFMKDIINPLVANQGQKAIERIQSRLGNVERGWVSLDEMEEKEGGISIKNNNDGSLSVAED